MNAQFEYKGHQVEITGDPSTPTITLDGKDYTPLWNGGQSPEAFIKGHIDGQLRSKLEFQIRDQEIANKAKGWKPQAVNGQRSPARLVLSSFFLAWYLGLPIIFFIVWWPQSVAMMVGMLQYGHMDFKVWSEMMAQLPTMVFIGVVLWVFGGPVLVRLIQSCYKAAK